MNIETLRALSRSYAAGNIDREAYRLERRELLARIAAGEIPVIPYRPPEPESPTVFPDSDDDGDTTQEVIPITGPLKSGPPKSQFSFVAVAVFAVIGAGIVWMTLNTNEKESAPPQAVTVEPAPAESVDLIATFLAENAWAPERILGLRKEWNHVSAADRDVLRRSDSMRRLTDAVLEQIAAESALIAIGDAEEALDTQEQLLDLVDDLGISNERLSRARTTWITTREERLAEQALTSAISSGGAGAEPDAAVAIDPQTSATVPEQAPDDSAIREAAEGEETGSAAQEHALPLPPESDPEAITESVAEQTVTAAAPNAGRSGETVAALDTKSVRSNCKAELAKKRRPYCMDILESGVKGPVLVVLPSGAFEMGGARDGEGPRRTITLDYHIAMGMFEISAAELTQYCEAASRPCPPQPWKVPQLPAVNVSWDLANEFTDWLTEITGAAYRLPSESEWEYAARAGTTTSYPFGNEIVPTDAHYCFKNAETEPLPTKDRSVNRNEFRLYHMVGNVREWVTDTWATTYVGAPADGSPRTASGVGDRVVRGGSYADRADALRSAARVSQPAGEGNRFTGFRVVRVID